jgi:hypothetical protein
MIEKLDLFFPVMMNGEEMLYLACPSFLVCLSSLPSGAHSIVIAAERAVPAVPCPFRPPGKCHSVLYQKLYVFNCSDYCPSPTVWSPFIRPSRDLSRQSDFF